MFGLDQAKHKVHSLSSSLFGADDGDNDDSDKKDDEKPHIPDEVKPKPANEDMRPKKEMITGDPRLPREYNAREAFPECNPEILNQQMCGSCWAFASSGVLSDRFCIHSNG